MDCNSGSIEKLPDDILIRILQSLPLIDSVPTRLLSRRWKILWHKSCSQLQNLCFDINNLIGAAIEDPKGIQRHPKNLKLILDREYHGMSSQIIEDFVKGVDMVVQCRPDAEQDQDALLGVNSLEIRFLLRGTHSDRIDNWLSSTVTSITKQLILVFYLPLPWIPSDEPSEAVLYAESKLYDFPSEVLLNLNNSSLEYLQLEFISVKLPPKLDCFATLRTLRLNTNNLTQEDVHRLFSGCPVLEFFKIQNCHNLVALQVSSPLPHLKKLILENCRKLTRIELGAENLSNFEYDTAAKTDHLMLRGCRKLTNVAVCELDYGFVYSDNFHPLSNDFPFVTTLFLTSKLEYMGDILRDNIFAHLKILTIFSCAEGYECVGHFPSLLSEVAPMLEEFVLHAWPLISLWECPFDNVLYAEINNQIISYGGPWHPHLKKVVFTGFAGEMGQILLAKYFLRKARRLQIMTLDPLINTYNEFDAMESLGERHIDNRCKTAYELLSAEVPEHAELILVGYNSGC